MLTSPTELLVAIEAYQVNEQGYQKRIEAAEIEIAKASKAEKAGTVLLHLTMRTR
jgi:hypothetical protein